MATNSTSSVGISKTSLYGILTVLSAVVAYALNGLTTGNWLDLTVLAALAAAVAAAFGLKAAAPKEPTQ